uniref:SAP domain-containing protein n=1 Tax=Ditylum brightwellii TaxID=49249 RepID=A0A7S4VSS7_9STRA
MIVLSIGSLITAPILVLLSTLEAPTNINLSSTAPVPALEIIKTYGSLAGSECYGRTAPPASSCQIPLSDLKKELGVSNKSGIKSLTRSEFANRLESLSFQWPLKPYGLTDTSYTKTAVMNKGAETAMYMNELEKRGYDRRNPTGPLPTSLRPKLNEELKREGIDPRALDKVFYSFSGNQEELTSEQLENAFRGSDFLDYYSFIELIGKNEIVWPSY